jgi:hypothetical protein
VWSLHELPYLDAFVFLFLRKSLYPFLCLGHGGAFDTRTQRGMVGWLVLVMGAGQQHMGLEVVAVENRERGCRTKAGGGGQHEISGFMS